MQNPDFIEVLSTHPSTEQRIKELQQLTAGSSTQYDKVQFDLTKLKSML